MTNAAKMNDFAEVAWVQECFPADCRPTELESLGGAGGFSGARLWRLHTPRGLLCLRRWPEYPGRTQLEWIHKTLHELARTLDFLPAPIAARDGSTLIDRGNALWDMTPWMPGQPTSTSQPILSTRRAASMRALAAVHLAGEQIEQKKGKSLAISRAAIGTEMLVPLFSQIEQAVTALGRGDVAPNSWLAQVVQPTRLYPLAYRILTVSRGRIDTNTATRVLDPYFSVEYSQFPCIGDPRIEHFLFTGDQVTGIIDFGAMRLDVAEADIARLLQTMLPNDVDQWLLALHEYSQVRPAMLDRTLIESLIRVGMLASGCKWLQWLLIENREFDDFEQILARLERGVGRLEQMFTP